MKKEIFSGKGIPYFLRKHGVYYGHNSCGYVSNFMLAEIYNEDYAKSYAKQHEDIHAVPITDISINVDEMQNYIDRMEAMRDFISTQPNDTAKEWELE